MNQNFRFTSASNQDEYIYNPPDRKFKYYQLCSFKNPYNSKYHIRRFIVNSRNEFVNIQEGYITSKEYNRFIQSHKLNEYKQYNTYDLNQVNYPNMGEISIVQSPILDCDAIGNFAKF
jgi:hypothetical protein